MSQPEVVTTQEKNTVPHADEAPRSAKLFQLAAAFLTFLLLSPVYATADGTKHFDIGTQALSSALGEFARQSDRQILFSTEVVDSKRTSGIKGELEPEVALRQLLKGTGLTYRVTADNTILVDDPKAGESAQNPSSGSSPLRARGEGQGVRVAQATGDKSKRESKGFWKRLRLAQAEGDDKTKGMQKVQDENSSDSAKAEDENQLDEIMVTARRREESLQEVPETVQVLSQGVLEANNISTLNDLQYMVPGLSAFTNTPLLSVVALRGQGAVSNTPGVVMFLDEVPIPSFSGSTVNMPGLFFDLENVQILKGPQGTLFGYGSVGGDILLRSRRPTNEWGGNIQAGFGNYNSREVQGAFNVPLIEDKLLARISFTRESRDGYTQLLGTPSNPNGIDADNLDAHSLRLILSYRPTDWLQNDTIYNEAVSTGRPSYGVLVLGQPGLIFANAYPDVPALAAEQKALGVRTLLPIGVDPVGNSLSRSVSNITTITLSENISIKNIAGYFKQSNSLAGDQDGTVHPELDIYATPKHWEITQYSDELQLIGNAFGQRLDWIVGGFYEHQPLPGTYIAENYVALGNPSNDENRSEQKSTAVYGHGIFDMSNWIHGLSVSAGIRRAHDSRITDYFVPAVQQFCVGPPNDCVDGPVTRTKQTSSATTWTAGLTEQLTDHTLTYLTVSKGYRPGGENGINLQTSEINPGYGPEEVLEYELGVKSDWSLAGMPVRTNAAVWFQDYTNIQLLVLHPLPVGAYIENAGQAHIKGFELETLADLTSSLEWGLNYGYGRIRYVDFLPGTDEGAIANLQATRTKNFPPHKVSTYLQYELPLAQNIGKVSLRATYNWQAKSGDTSAFEGLGMQRAFGLLNFTADWDEIQGRPINLQFYMSNVTNEEYTTGQVQAWQPLYFGFGTKIYGQPRLYGLRLTYRFGSN